MWCGVLEIGVDYLDKQAVEKGALTPPDTVHNGSCVTCLEVCGSGSPSRRHAKERRTRHIFFFL
ncbi:hypothetical protein WG66_016195, partial [Moniliophthora roreri]